MQVFSYILIGLLILVIGYFAVRQCIGLVRDIKKIREKKKNRVNVEKKEDR